MELLVRSMIGAPNHVRDREVVIIDDACEMERRRAVVAPEHYAVKTLFDTRRSRRVEVALRPLALPDRPLVPGDAEPGEIVQDRLLAAGNVSRGIGVVDAKKEPIAEPPVRDCAERVPDVQRPGGARREADPRHGL